MTIKVTKNGDGSFDVSCGDENVRIGGPDSQPSAESGARGPSGGGAGVGGIKWPTGTGGGATANVVDIDGVLKAFPEDVRRELQPIDVADLVDLPEKWTWLQLGRVRNKDAPSAVFRWTGPGQFDVANVCSGLSRTGEVKIHIVNASGKGAK